MSSAASSSGVPWPNRHRRPTKPKNQTWKQPTDLGRFEVIDDWNHHDLSGWLAPYKPEGAENIKVWEQQGRVDRLRDLIPFWREGVLAAHKGKEVAKMEGFLQRLDEEEEIGVWQARNDGWGENIGEDVWGPPAEDNQWGLPTAELEGWGATSVEGWGLTPGQGWGSAGDQGWGEPAADDIWGADQARGWGDAADFPTVTAGPNGIPAGSETTTLSDANVWHTHRRSRGKQSARHAAAHGDSWTFVEEVARQEDASYERRRSMHEFYAMPTQEKVKKIQEMVDFLRVHA